MEKKATKLSDWLIRFLLLLLLLVSSDYIVRRDLIGKEKFIEYKKYTTANSIPPNYTVHGIDVSRHNGEIWWEQIAKTQIDSHKIAFAFMKATEGMFYYDREYADNWHSARKAGIIRGAYHYFRPSVSASWQAWNFILNSGVGKGDLPPVLDLETDDKMASFEVVTYTKTWLDIIEKHYGVRPIIYTNIQFYNKLYKGRLDDYPLWIAHYKQAKPAVPDTQPWLFWQHSERGQLYGINERVDMNVFNGNLDALKDLLIKK